MQYAITLFLVLALIFTTLNATAETSIIELRCEGTTYLYFDGFAPNAALQVKDTRIVKVDLANNS